MFFQVVQNSLKSRLFQLRVADRQSQTNEFTVIQTLHKRLQSFLLSVFLDLRNVDKNVLELGQLLQKNLKLLLESRITENQALHATEVQGKVSQFFKTLKHLEDSHYVWITQIRVKQVEVEDF